MSRDQSSSSAPLSPAAAFRFLDRCDNEIYSDDNGALLGQLSMLLAGAFRESHNSPQWHKAVSCAVSAH
jgi:hypothetical protein